MEQVIIILPLLLYVCDITSHHCGFLCWIPSWAWPKKAETSRRFATCFLSRSHHVKERVRKVII